MNDQPAQSSRAPKAGDVYFIGREASVQFAAEPFYFRVIRLVPGETYTGWYWLHGYRLDPAGEAVERRTIFVMRAGLSRDQSASLSRPARL